MVFAAGELFSIRLESSGGTGLCMFIAAGPPRLFHSTTARCQQTGGSLAALVPHSRKVVGFSLWLTVCSEKTSLCGHRSVPNDLHGPTADHRTCPSRSQPSILKSPVFFLRWSIDQWCMFNHKDKDMACIYECTPTRLAQQTNKLCGRGE